MALPYLTATIFNRSRQTQQMFGVFETLSAFWDFQAGVADAASYEPVLVFGAPPAASFRPNTPVAIQVGHIVALRFTGRIPSALREGEFTSLVMGYGPWDSIAAGQAWADSFPAADSFLNVVGPILPLPVR